LCILLARVVVELGRTGGVERMAIRGTTVVVKLVMVAVLVCVAIVVVILSVATVVGTVYMLSTLISQWRLVTLAL